MQIRAVLKKALWKELDVVGRNLGNFCLYILPRCFHSAQNVKNFKHVPGVLFSMIVSETW